MAAHYSDVLFRGKLTSAFIFYKLVFIEPFSMSKMDTSQLGFDLEQRQVYSVSQLNLEVKQLLQKNFPLLWIEGELSNVARPASGHIYFSLKDEKSQVRCAMFRNANRNLPFQPKDGLQVLLRARIGLYEPRGEYQLTVESMEEAGVGILQRKFEELKRKLTSEGLFDDAHKQILPSFPTMLSVVTSATGAAIRDILSVLRRRYPILAIRVYSVPVQGDSSASAIVSAIQAINHRKDSDVIILARGGGSIEDLWSFNEEIVARTIYASKLPIVTGVGHEVDFTIADFVADLRAATPSAAAELVAPHQQELLETFDQYRGVLQNIVQDQLRTLFQSIDWIAQRLEFLHPKQAIQRNQQQLLELRRRALSAIKLKLSDQQYRLSNLLIRFENQSPTFRVPEARIKLEYAHKHLRRLVRNQLEQRHQQLLALTRTLEAVSPLGTLNRGYAIVSRADNGQIVHKADQVSLHEKIFIQLAEGRLSAHVDKK